MQRRRGGNFALIVTNIALVGPGAVGTTVAALLYKAGNSLLVCGHTPRDSIELRPDGEDPILVPGPVRTDPDQVAGPVDVLLLAVKATQNDDARGWLTRLCGEHPIVVVLQNGVEQVEQVQPYCPSSAGPGHRVVFGGDPTRRVGATARRGRTGAAERTCGGHGRRAVTRRRLPGGLRPGLQNCRLAQAAPQRPGRIHGAVRAAVGHVPP